MRTSSPHLFPHSSSIFAGHPWIFPHLLGPPPAPPHRLHQSSSPGLRKRRAAFEARKSAAAAAEAPVTMEAIELCFGEEIEEVARHRWPGHGVGDLMAWVVAKHRYSYCWLKDGCSFFCYGEAKSHLFILRERVSMTIIVDDRHMNVNH